MQATSEGGGITYISPISAWEIGMLASRGRLQLLIRPERWFSNLFHAPGVLLADMSPDLLIASSYLPGKPPRDPTDRIIAATARDLGATLVTRDRALLPTASRATSRCWSAEASRHCEEPPNKVQ